jgi:kumamolisin
VTGTGGTSLFGKDGKATSETTWNDGKDSSGGGGISRIFKTPLFQKLLNLPLNKDDGTAGRGVPDIAGNGDPVTGYRIRVNGKEGVIGGTSAVAPLYAALTMRINEALGKPVGPLNDWLYGPGLKAGIFNDIVKGTNNGYPAGKGWDAVTGLGSIDGQKMLDALQGKTPSGGVKGRFSAFTESLPLFGTPVGSDVQQKSGS